MADMLGPGSTAELYHSVREVDCQMHKHLHGEGLITEDDWKVIRSNLSVQAARIKELEVELAEQRETLTIAHMDGYHKGKAAMSKERDALKARCEALEMENSGLESALAGEKAAREHDRSVRWALPENLVDGCPEDIRALGWAVAVHNDYRLDGVKHTFWLFTKSDRCMKGEGLTDAEALNEIRAALRAAGE